MDPCKLNDKGHLVKNYLSLVSRKEQYNILIILGKKIKMTYLSIDLIVQATWLGIQLCLIASVFFCSVNGLTNGGHFSCRV